MVIKVVKEDISKILARGDITESTQWLSVKKQKEVVFTEISPCLIAGEKGCTLAFHYNGNGLFSRL